MVDAPFTMFGVTRNVPVRVYVNGRPVEGADFEAELWVEREEDMYAFDSPQFRGKRVRVVRPNDWRGAARW